MATRWSIDIEQAARELADVYDVFVKNDAGSPHVIPGEMMNEFLDELFISNSPENVAVKLHKPLSWAELLT
jgi:hypothetical protein